MPRSTHCFAIVAIVLLIAAAVQPLTAQPARITSFPAPEPSCISPVTASALTMIAQTRAIANQQRDSGLDVDALQRQTPVADRTDTDGDGLYDPVEWVLGTDCNNSDSDFDQLDDSFEVYNDLDPLKPDSNDDGLADYFEVNNVTSLDLDGDDYPNAWDVDNDGDGVVDALDLSPFSRSTTHESIHFDIQTNGNPAYINFQLRPENPDHLRQTLQTWDWPPDWEGAMKDTNVSREDVHITPMLEFTIPITCTVTANHSGKCLEVYNASLDDGANVQQANCSSASNQLWRLEQVNNGYYRILAHHSGKCLEVYNASLDDGANVQQANCSGQDNQLWKLEAVGNNLFKISAKHSGKCLEAFNSTADGAIVSDANVYQADFWSHDNQLWKLDPVENALPSQSLVDEYHIMINFNKAYIPLSPTREYGASVALAGRMFFPAAAPLDLSADAQLVWTVTAQTDSAAEKIALKAPNGWDVRVKDSGDNALYVQPPAIGGREKFELIYVAENKVGLKVQGGQFVGVDHVKLMYWEWNPLVANRGTIGEKETFILERIDDKIALKAYNGKYVCVGCGDALYRGGLNADSTVPVYFDLIELEEIASETTILARYKEDFQLTGFTVDENYGSEVGVFYSDDIDRTLAADFVMAYEFLRNTTTHIADMPAILTASNVIIAANTRAFSHQDAGLVELTGNMTLDALDSLPEGMNLPLLIAFEDRFTSRAMDDLVVAGSYITGDTYAVDLSAVPVVTTKTLKMSWYNTSTNESLEIDDLLTEIQEWGQAKGLDDDTMATMMGLMLAWDTGESTVIRIGSADTTFDTPGKNAVLDAIEDYGIGGVELIAASIIPIYAVIRTFKMQPTVLAKALNIGRWKLLKLRWKSTMNCKIGWVGKVGRVAKVVAIIGLIIDVGIALGYLIYFLATSDPSAFEIWYASFYTTMVVAFAVALFLIGLLASGPVGWIIVAIIAVIDFILEIFGVGFSKFVEWFISLFYDIDELTKVELEMKETTLNVDDYDDNSLTAGDHIEFKSRIVGKVWGDPGCLDNSYITPSYQYSVPSGSASAQDKFNNYPSDWTYQYREICFWFFDREICYTLPEKVREYETGVWVKPLSMINFPLTVWLASSYKVYYEECWWFFGWHCDTESTSKTSNSERTTLYFDVLPQTITDFLYWRQIASLDRDGDELFNSAEQANRTNQWRFDTDNDALSDKFELDYGTNPTRSDTDGDGLNDALELRLNTDPFVTDTDDDGLSDAEEHKGWQITFTYYGHEFTGKVWSNPLSDDTDNDGLSDLEEFMKRLNPRSGDTNGNGVPDPNESITPLYGSIRSVDLNGMGSSINILPGEPVNATVEYRLIGVRDPDSGTPASCSILITMDNSSLNETIYNGTPVIGNRTEGSFNFSFNASNTEGIYELRCLWKWSHLVETLPEAEREVIGVIITTNNTSAEWVADGPDTDGDGIIDLNEAIGWDVTFTDANGTHTIHVNSDPRRSDTDSDGLTDLEEWNWFTDSSDPRSADTDGDGVTDLVEIFWDYDVLSFDTDGDGLDDGTELAFNSDPKDEDTDDDGLNDKEEFEFNSDPDNPDTDGDGLNDRAEKECGSSLLQPDPDDDTLFDTLECALGTDPWNPDTDDDGLLDGYEVHALNTSPLLNDSDFDLLNDGEELRWKTDPLCNDTDRDGLWDGTELELGTNPLYRDTDYDSINDSEDPDSFAEHVEHIVLACDPATEIDEFADNLALYTNVTTITADELLANYTAEPYIVLVGRPDGGDGTVGNITRNVLADDNETLARMLESEYDRFAIKYGVWNSTQTVVMLSQPYPADHWRALMMLKSLRETVLPGSVEIAWPTPRDVLRVDSENVLKETDALVWIALDAAVIPRVKLSRYTEATTPVALTPATGMAYYDTPVGRYLEINVSENIQNATNENVKQAWIFVYYTAADLDRTGDGLANDTRDIDENTLRLYSFNENTGRWAKLTNKTSWVFETGVNTTNVELYGMSYEGYIWANVSHFSLYSVVSEGSPRRGGGYTPRDADGDGYTDVEELLAGTDPEDPEDYPGKPVVTLSPAPEPSPVSTSAPMPATPIPTTTIPTTPPATPLPEEPGFETVLWLMGLGCAVILAMAARKTRRRV
ncbi:MAG: RICIN domain-containing protein [Candidatus Methanospirareceae archaeon]